METRLERTPWHVGQDIGGVFILDAEGYRMCDVWTDFQDCDPLARAQRICNAVNMYSEWLRKIEERAKQNDNQRNGKKRKVA